MSKAPLLTKEEELSLLERAHFAETAAERIAARNELVMRNYALIFDTTKKTYRCGFTIEECISVAVEAYIYSIERFNFEGGRLSTYALTAMQHKVYRWAREQAGAVRCPAVFHNKKQLDKASDDVKRAVALAQKRHLSTDYTVSDGSGDEFPSIGQQIPFRDADELHDGPTPDELYAAINQLDDRLRDIIVMRMEGARLQDVGDFLGLSKERIRQLLEKAHAKLRKSLARYEPNGAR